MLAARFPSTDRDWAAFVGAEGEVFMGPIKPLGKHTVVVATQVEGEKKYVITIDPPERKTTTRVFEGTKETRLFEKHYI